MNTPPGQPDHRSTKVPVTRHVARPHPPAQRPYSDHSQEQTTLTISNAASVCRLHYWPRPHRSLATLPHSNWTHLYYSRVPQMQPQCLAAFRPSLLSGWRRHRWFTFTSHHSITGIPHYRPSAPNSSELTVFLLSNYVDEWPTASSSTHFVVPLSTQPV